MSRHQLLPALHPHSLHHNCPSTNDFKGHRTRSLLYHLLPVCKLPGMMSEAAETQCLLYNPLTVCVAGQPALCCWRTLCCSAAAHWLCCSLSQSWPSVSCQKNCIQRSENCVHSCYQLFLPTVCVTAAPQRMISKAAGHDPSFITCCRSVCYLE